MEDFEESSSQHPCQGLPSVKSDKFFANPFATYFQDKTNKIHQSFPSSVPPEVHPTHTPALFSTFVYVSEDKVLKIIHLFSHQVFLT